MNTEQDYITARTKRTQRLQRIFAVVSIVSFAGSGAFGASQFLRGAVQPASQPTPEAASRESRLKTQERGYEMVLQREPENQLALEGLVNTRLQLRDGRGAIAPLEKLAKRYPDRQDYKVVLAQVKKLSGGDR